MEKGYIILPRELFNSDSIASVGTRHAALLLDLFTKKIEKN